MTDLVVSDASPLVIAAKLDLLKHLPSILDSVIYLPSEVAEECTHDLAKAGASEITAAIHNGLLVVEEVQQNHEFLSRIPYGIDDGEAKAICLAIKMKAKLLIDDRKGRKAAKLEGVTVFGFGAVLVKAKQTGVIDSVTPILEQMINQGYRLSERVMAEISKLCGES